MLWYTTGARGQALGWKFKQSPLLGRLSLNVPGVHTVADAVKYADDEGVDLVVPGSEEAFDEGIVDKLAARGIAAFGPTEAAAKLETDKAFAKWVAQKADVPTAGFQVFDDPRAAYAYIDNREAEGSVVKASGPAAGKGAEVCTTREDARRSINDLMVLRTLGAAGAIVVIENVLEPPEWSLHALCANGVAEPFISAEDHKQVGDGDTGPNTGGMGVRTPVPGMPLAVVERLNKIFVPPPLRVLDRLGIPYRGIVYTGGMGDPTKDPRLLEWNARFGDPELPAYVPLMKSDLLKLIVDCMNNQLQPGSLTWSDEHAICIVAAARGYPREYKSGMEIHGLAEAAQQEGVVIFPAGVVEQDGRFFTAGGRVLDVTAKGKTPELARARGYAAMRLIRFGDSDDNMHYRTDIGTRRQQAA